MKVKLSKTEISTIIYSLDDGLRTMENNPPRGLRFNQTYKLRTKLQTLIGVENIRSGPRL